ncbi:SMI1/KNR4 family protein [Nocardia terpenica]|uniref:SMI1/KNR4 family protein n=1 Tax=Nocardia terpenica TaxID=455432 RepID=UPI001895CB0B|nr:SMI1/KNR4 family protein [Nocardia terpenica]MBF6060940.1 SMI1/KNR4 family protein [Nocardia terpenica]MBF6111426.1 SMI1/KNR4 family protein [Nocardia terpenica]MBF6118421.1 SMI1/KNR4 family protein [Nocardia terpenica]MBF6155743.1 SMI1/KNR4 family protein [Nocardia terpenica]
MRDWQGLIDAIDREIHREESPFRTGKRNPGATEQVIRAAERRLDFRFDPVYREYLTHVDGWVQFNAVEASLYGLDELGAPAWAGEQSILAEWSREYREVVVPLGMPDLSDMLLVGGSAQIGLFMLLVPPAASSAAGRVVELTDEPQIHADFHAYLEKELTFWKFCNEPEDD